MAILIIAGTGAVTESSRADHVIGLLANGEQCFAQEQRTADEAQLHSEGVRQIQLVMMLQQKMDVCFMIHLVLANSEIEGHYCSCALRESLTFTILPKPLPLTTSLTSGFAGYIGCRLLCDLYHCQL